MNGQTVSLPYRPVTAEYSNYLDRIIFIAANPNQLHIFDPITNTDTAVNLPAPPLSLSISLDGQHAAVGHDALISYVNLTGAYLEKTLTANVTVNSLVLGNGYVYILTYSGGTQWIPLSTGSSGSIGVYNGTSGRLHPSGTAIYTTEDGLSPEHLQDLNISTGPVTNAAQGPYHGDYPVCGGVWFSPDGRRTYTGCGTAYQAAPQDANLGLICCGNGPLDTKADDLYWATLVGAPLIRSLSESATLGRVAAIPSSYQYSSPPNIDNQVLLYDSAYLEPAGTFQLPGFVVNSNTYQAHGQQVFYNQASTALYVVMQADSSSGLLNNFAVQIFSLNTPQACTPTFNAGSAVLASTGTVATVGITAPAACIYQASTDSSWIQLISGAYGSGNGTVTFVVRPNSGAARTGHVAIGGQSYAVSQPAASTSPSALTQLGYSIVGADYSKALDKVVAIVSNPKELHIYDPASGSDQIVPLPKPPLCVSVGPDGLSAAVGFDGWLSIVDLSTAVVTSTIQVFTDVHTILLGGHGYVYAYPQRTWASLFSVQIATSAIDSATAIYNGRYPRRYVDGNSFYTEGSKWDISQGPAVILTQNSSGGCAPFWLTEDGNRMITSCGSAYTTSTVPSLDLQYNGSFSNAASIQWADESVTQHSTAVIPGGGSNNTGDTYLQIYGDVYLGYSGNLALPTFPAGSSTYPGHGRYVFWNRLENKMVVLEQADSTANLSADYGATVYPLTTQGCSYSLGAHSASVGSNGGVNTVSVTTGAGCAWNSVSNASWLTLDSGEVGFGSNTVQYTVAPNTSPSSRTGTITIAGSTFTVTQGTAIPSIGVIPTAGSGTTQVFTMQVSDAAGATDLLTVLLYFNATFSGSANSCMVEYARPSNLLYLLNDAGTAWSSASIGSTGSLSNSQCSFNTASATVSPSANGLVLNLPVTFASTYVGVKNIYAYAAGSSANSGWQTLGTWSVPGTVAVNAVSVSPASGSGLQQTFAVQYSDSIGATDLSTTFVYFNATFAPSTNSCLVEFYRPSNTLYLLNDAGTAWSAATVGSSATLSNSQCSINAASSSASLSANALMLSLPVTFAATYVGVKNIYAYAAGSTANSGWQTLGTWSVPGTVAVNAVSVSPASGSGLQQTFALQYSDSVGATDLSTTFVYFNATFAPSTNSCLVEFYRPSNTLYLLNDAGTAWSAATVGSSATLSNSQCSINAASSSASLSANALMLNLPVTFAATYVGVKNIYAYAAGSSANSGWQTLGSWTAP